MLCSSQNNNNQYILHPYIIFLKIKLKNKNNYKNLIKYHDVINKKNCDK